MSATGDRLAMIGRGAGCLLAAVPSTFLIPLPLTMALTRRYRREEMLRRLHLMVPWAAFCRKYLLGIELEVSGREHLPRPSKGHLYVSNHQSWADIVVLMEALDTVAFLSKTLVKRIPIIGRCAYAGGTVYVERDDAESRQRALRETLRMCEESTAVVVFPEGTRSPDGELRKNIHSAGLRAAFKHRLKAVPLAIDGTWRVLPKAMDQVRPGRVAVCIGPPFNPTDFADGTTWSRAIWDRVKELHAQARGRLQGTVA